MDIAHRRDSAASMLATWAPTGRGQLASILARISKGPACRLSLSASNILGMEMVMVVMRQHLGRGAALDHRDWRPRR